MVINRIVRGFVIASFAAVLCSCAGMQSARKGDNLFYSNKFSEAAKEYSDGASAKFSINKTLYLLNLAASRFWEKNYSETLRILTEAEELNFEKNFIVSSVIASDRLPYQLKELDLAYLHFFKAVCFYYLNDTEKCLIELRKSLINEPQSVFSELLLGCISIKNLRDYNTGMVSMRKIISIDDTFLPAYDILASTLKSLGYEEESAKNINSVLSKYSDYYFFQDYNFFEPVIIFADLPKSVNDINYSQYSLEIYNKLKTQYKISKAVDSEDNEQILNILFKEVSPSYIPVPEPRSKSGINAFLNLDNIAVKSFNTNIPEQKIKDIITKTAYNLFKDEIKDEIRRKTTRDAKPIGWLIRGKDSMDPRFWNTLPGRLNVFFLKLKPGVYNFKISLFNDEKRFLKEYEIENITVAQNKLNLHFCRLGYDLMN